MDSSPLLRTCYPYLTQRYLKGSIRLLQIVSLWTHLGSCLKLPSMLSFPQMSFLPQEAIHHCAHPLIPASKLRIPPTSSVYPQASLLFRSTNYWSLLPRRLKEVLDQRHQHDQKRRYWPDRMDLGFLFHFQIGCGSIHWNHFGLGFHVTPKDSLFHQLIL